MIMKLDKIKVFDILVIVYIVPNLDNELKKYLWLNLMMRRGNIYGGPKYFVGDI